MNNESRVTLDNSILKHRLRQQPFEAGYVKRPPRSQNPQVINDITNKHRPPYSQSYVSKNIIQHRQIQPIKIAPSPQENMVVNNNRVTAPLNNEHLNNDQSVLQAQFTNQKPDHLKLINRFKKINPRKVFNKSLVALAVIIILSGGYISYMGVHANHIAIAQATRLTHQANKAAITGVVPSKVLSTIKPTAKVVSSYVVEPNYPKYLIIPSIGVNSIVSQTGILANGALGTPYNVFYTDWYTGSALPGQPGATLIDGHVSSWTAHGVFYNLHNLKAGDAIQIVKGNNQVVNYKVVKTVFYPANKVNMQAAITPVTNGVSGLNLITCTGQVIPGTSLFNERVIVFAQEV